MDVSPVWKKVKAGYKQNGAAAVRMISAAKTANDMMNAFTTVVALIDQGLSAFLKSCFDHAIQSFYEWLFHETVSRGVKWGVRTGMCATYWMLQHKDSGVSAGRISFSFSNLTH